MAMIILVVVVVVDDDNDCNNRLKNLVMGLLFASATDTVKDDSANQYLAPVLSGRNQLPTTTVTEL